MLNIIEDIENEFKVKLTDDLEKEVSKEYPQYKAGYIAGVRDFLDIFHLTESKVRDIAKGKAK